MSENWPFIWEQLEVLRRIAERGRKKALDKNDDWATNHEYAVDLFQHILDELERLKGALR
jgi:hypothetical protein